MQPEQKPQTPGILAEHLARTPALRSHLARLCDRCDRQGELKGTAKLGDASLPAEERRALAALFGGSLKTTARGEHRLDLARFLASVPDEQGWVAELYQALGRRPGNLARQQARARTFWRQLVDQIRLAFPDLAPIHQLLAGQEERRANGLDGNRAQALRDEWFALAEAVSLLRRNRRQIGLSDLGARFFGDSKALRSGRLRTTLCQWLDALDAGDATEETESADLLARYGVADNPTSIKVTLFGRLRYCGSEGWTDWPCPLRGRGQSATLSLDNLAGVVEAEFLDGPEVVTCENETPFNHLIREAHPLPVIYTAGFPNAAVRLLLEKLPASATIRHWGDSDLAGYRIAGILARIRPLSLWRCALADLERHRHALRPLDESERTAIRQFLERHPDHPFAAELRYTLANGWLEQESW